MGSEKSCVLFVAALALVAAVNAQRCPIGTFRDPVTGQCAGPNAGLLTTQGCPIGQFREPVTGQCVGPNVGANFGPVNVPMVFDVLQQCPPGTVQDMFTGQCNPYRNWQGMLYEG